ncbi:MAG TPA: CPBP family glutamic-type intramembrane protease [Anaerolineales bacterium]|nr:CPBP family glutamic-type intramembrane protease [Anaerolineales bacterium]
MKWIAPTLAYLAVSVGLFIFHSAWGALLGFHAVIVVSVLIARPNIPLSVLVRSDNIKWLVLSIMLCGSSGVILYFLWDIFGFANDLSGQIASLGLNASNWPVFIAYFASVNPFVEEYFWRGYLGNNTKNLHSSDLLYAGFHALILINKVQTGAILFGVGALVFAGWLWRQIVREDGGLLAPVLGHMVADLTILVTVFRMVS